MFMQKTISRNQLVFILLAAIFFSCEPKVKIEKTYVNGKLSSIRYYSKNDTNIYYIKHFEANNKIKAEGRKERNVKTGKWKYYDKGKISAIENYCENGFLCDTQVYFFPNGKVDRFKILDQPIKCFCDIEQHYSFTQIAFWRNGRLREINHIKNCTFNGLTKLFDSASGKLECEFYETSGKYNGLYRKYYSDGSTMSGYYKMGTPIGEWKTIKGDSLISSKKYE
jgi:antitoxin component YwqK of YwqJK toxin-antitoxin module